MGAQDKKILVVNLTRLGDILQSTPLLRALKDVDPSARIHYLAVSGFAEVCRFIPEIDEIVPFDFNSAVAVSKEAIRYLPRRLDEIKDFVESLRREKFDIVINLSHSRISALVCHLLGVADTRGLTLDREGYRQIRHPWAKYFFTANLNRSYNRFNLVDIHLGLAYPEGESIPGKQTQRDGFPRWKLSVRIPDEALPKALALLKEWEGNSSRFKIGFQPGASMFCKRWPAEAFVSLGKKLLENLPAGILVLGSQTEAGLGQQIAAPLGAKARNIAGKTNIGALGALLSQMNLLITNDTGTQHLAAAVGTPVLSLCFGSALSHETGPYGRGHLVIEPNISCFPCSFHVECHRYRCQEQVRPEAIYRIAEMMLKYESENIPNLAEEPDLQQLRVWRTDFDQDGFWTLRPAIPRSLRASDFINIASRLIWKGILRVSDEAMEISAESDPAVLTDYFEDYLEPETSSFSVELEESHRAFLALMRLAGTGKNLCRDLEKAGQWPMNCLEILQKTGDEIAALDREITMIGMKLPCVNHLVLDFTFGKQNLEGDDIQHLAHQTGLLYDRLLRSARKHVDMIGRQGEIFESIGWKSLRAEGVPSVPLMELEPAPLGTDPSESRDRLTREAECRTL